VRDGKLHHVPDPCTLAKIKGSAPLRTVPQQDIDSTPIGRPIPASPGCR
jgi:hypothetical protein